MKTINENIQIFTNFSKAQKYFEKCASCQLLESFTFGKTIWFVDISKEAIVHYPNHYVILNEK
jgi:hypothetical protein